MDNLFEKFGIKTENEMLYVMAFTHASYSSKHDLSYNYERLEFLGDSVLGMVIAEYIYKKYPHYGEGSLTKLRANYVCQNALIYYSHELNLQDYIDIDTEDTLLTEHEVLSITADVFESFLGAMFLDQGIEFAKNFLVDHVFQYIDEERIFFRDYKSAIKEYCDAEEIDIKYVIVNEEGFPHAKTFIISLFLDGDEKGIGKGRSKKDAEQAAAKMALEKLEIPVF